MDNRFFDRFVILCLFFVFFGKLVEMALASLRSKLTHKGQRLPGALIALFEYTFWLCITASALADFDDALLKIVVLVCAFAMGNVLDSVIEEKIVRGYCTITGIFIEKTVALSAADPDVVVTIQTMQQVKGDNISNTMKYISLT